MHKYSYNIINIQIIHDIKWKIFYIIFSFLLTFIVCVDSWEYILNFEIDFLINSNTNFSNTTNKLNTGFVLTKIEEGQALIYFVAFFYSFIFTIIIMLFFISIFVLPALYKEEILNLFINFFILIGLFGIIFFFNHNIIFPILCQDLLQYKYSNLNDFVLSLRIEPLLSILDFVKIKLKLLSLLYAVTLYWYFLYWIGKQNKKFIYFIIHFRVIIIFFISLIIIFFFETEIYITTYMIILNWIIFESLLFLVMLQKKYKNTKSL